MLPLVVRPHHTNLILKSSTISKKFLKIPATSKTSMPLLADDSLVKVKWIESEEEL